MSGAGAEVVEKTMFEDANGDKFRITATFGLADIHPGSTMESMVMEADSALYTGKNQGRDNIIVYRERWSGGWIIVFSAGGFESS